MQCAERTTLSALCSGAPIKSRRDVYKALQRIDFASLFGKKLGPVSAAGFNVWHARAVVELVAGEPRRTVG